MGRVLVLLIFLFSSSAIASDWSKRGSTVYAGDGALAAYASSGTGNCTAVTNGHAPEVLTAFTQQTYDGKCNGLISAFGVAWTYTCNSGYQFNNDLQNPGCTLCPSGVCPNSCTIDNGVKHSWYAAIDVSPGDKFCLGGCEVITQRYYVASVLHPNKLLAVGNGSGLLCTEYKATVNEGGESQTLSDGGAGVCAENSKICLSMQKQNCGYVNGEYRCVTTTQFTDENPCVQTASGAVFCKADAPTKPLAPTNPDGTPANPDVVFHFTVPNGIASVVNYYGSLTVTNGAENPGNDNGGDEAGKGDCGSKNTPCHVVVDQGGTADGIGTGGGGGGGDGETSLSGGGDCAAPPSCDGDPISCYLAQQAWTQSCVFQQPDNQTFDAKVDAGFGTTERGGLLPKISEVDVGAKLDSALQTGAGRSLSDQSVDLGADHGGVISLHWTPDALSALAVIRFMVLVSCALASVRIVGSAW